MAGVANGLAQKADWHNMAWQGYEGCGEHHYVVNFFGNVISRLRLIPAEAPDEPDGKPEPSKDIAVIATVDRLRGSRATHAELLRDFARHLMVPGDCYLVGLEERGVEPERWEVRSLDEVQGTPGQYVLVSKPGQSISTGRKLTSSDFIARIWLPHPRYRELADSPTRAVLDAIELLAIIQRAYRAIVRSRIPASALVLIPQSWSPGPPDPTTSNAPGGESKNNPLIDDLETAFVTPTYDEGHPGQVAPFIIEYPDRPDKNESGLEVKEIPRALDQLLPKLEEQALRRLAQGLNAPIEVVFGLGDTNDWSGGVVEEAVFREHVEPLAILICDSLTQAYLRPSLIDLGMTPDEASRYMVWYDSSSLVIHTNRQKSVTDGVKIGAVGGKAWRRELGFNEEDAPTPEEIDQLIKILSPGRQGQPPGEQPSQQPKEDVVGPGAPPNEPGSDDNPETENSISTLGRALYELDRDFLVAQHASAEAAMSRALDRAGARVATLVRRNTQLTAVLKNCPRKEAVARLGESVLAEFDTSAFQLLRNSFDDHIVDFRARATKTFKSALDLIPLENTDRENAERSFAYALDDAATTYETALMEHAANLLANPSFFTSDDSYPEGSLVPLPLIHSIRRLIGGGSGEDWRSITSGVIFQRALRLSGLCLHNGTRRNGDIEWSVGYMIAEHPTVAQDKVDG